MESGTKFCVNTGAGVQCTPRPCLPTEVVICDAGSSTCICAVALKPHPPTPPTLCSIAVTYDDPNLPDVRFQGECGEVEVQLALAMALARIIAARQ